MLRISFISNAKIMGIGETDYHFPKADDDGVFKYLEKGGLCKQIGKLLETHPLTLRGVKWIVIHKGNFRSYIGMYLKMKKKDETGQQQ